MNRRFTPDHENSRIACLSESMDCGYFKRGVAFAGLPTFGRPGSLARGDAHRSALRHRQFRRRVGDEVGSVALSEQTRTKAEGQYRRTRGSSGSAHAGVRGIMCLSPRLSPRFGCPLGCSAGTHHTQVHSRSWHQRRNRAFFTSRSTSLAGLNHMWGPNPSLHRTAYSRLRLLPSAGEIKRCAQAPISEDEYGI